MKTITFFILGIASFIAFGQKPMLCAHIEDKWHFYDTNGKEMFEAHTARATLPQGWVNGMVSVLQVVNAELDENQSIVPIFRRVLLDVKGNVVLEPKLKDSYRIVTPIDEMGYASLMNQETGEIMICEKDGEIAPFPKNATSISYKGEGIIEFIAREDSLKEEENPFKTLYDMKQNKVIKRGKWISIGRYHQGISFISDKNLKLGVLDRKGETIIPNLYTSPIDDEYAFTDEMEHEYIVLKDSMDAYVIFNKAGKQITDQSYVEMPIVNNGYISVWDEDKQWYIIDGNGKTIAPEAWVNNQSIAGVNEAGIAAITKDDVYMVINKEGKTLVGIEKGYVAAVTSPSSIFLSKDNQNWDVYNAKGKLIRSVLADDISLFEQFHYAPFSVKDQYGLISDEGKVIIPLGNYEFSTISDDFFETKVIDGDDIRYQYWNPSGKMVLKDPIQDLGADWIIPVEPNAHYYTPL